MLVYHSYERTCAVYNGTCQSDGIVHIIIGNAGFSDTSPWTHNHWSLPNLEGLSKLNTLLRPQNFPYNFKIPVKFYIK